MARECQAYDGTWFTLPAQVIDKRLIEVWKRHPRDAAAREVTASHVVSRASWSQRDHERGFKAKTKFDAKCGELLRHESHEPTPIRRKRQREIFYWWQKEEIFYAVQKYNVEGLSEVRFKIQI